VTQDGGQHLAFIRFGDALLETAIRQE